MGGLTCIEPLLQTLPNERILYFGDTARTPYGSKSPETIEAFSLQIADYLVAQGAKILVIACNTISSTAIPALAARFPEARAQVQSAREKQDIGALGEAEGVLRRGLGQLFAVAEAYPELKANESFMQLQQRITSLENGIADRRELYNEAVNINNVRVEQFPDALIARVFAFEQKPLLEFSTIEKADVDVKALFS